MAATVVDLAEEIVTILTDATFTTAATVKRRWRPKHKIADGDLDSPQITVTPVNLYLEIQNRTRNGETWGIGVLLQQKLSAPAITGEDESEADALALLAQEIRDELKRISFTLDTETVKASPTGITQSVPQDPDDLDDHSVFTNLDVFTYLVIR